MTARRIDRIEGIARRQAAYDGVPRIPETAPSQPHHEIISDGRTVWVNSSDGGAIGRFCKLSSEVHDIHGQPLDCVAGLPFDELWERFKYSMLKFYGVTVGDEHKPVTSSHAYDRICRALEVQAPHSTRREIKDRARDYALRPRDLDMICPGLSGLQPGGLVRILAIIVNLKARYFGFGGEIPALNLKAANWYARWSRRVANRTAAKAKAREVAS